MKRPAKSYKAFPAAGFLVLLVLGLAGQASADKKPKFLYVANSGTAASGDVIKTFQVTATAVCGDSLCHLPISISGTFTFDVTTGVVNGGTMFMTDASDLASSPLAVPFDLYLPSSFPGDTVVFFEVPGRTSTQSPTYVELIFPFSAFPNSYSGGPLCTAIGPGCVVISGAEIGTANVNPSLFPTTMNGTNLSSAEITSGSVTLVGISGGSQGTGGVSGYAIDSTTGALSLVPGSPFATGTGAGLIAANPSGKFVYVIGNSGISAYAVDGTTGALTAVSGSPLAAGRGSLSVAIDQSGKFLYVADDISHNNIWGYTIDATTGALTPVPGSPFDTEATPFDIGRGNASAAAIDPLGKFLYVPTEKGALLTFKIDSNTGALTLASSSGYGEGAQPATIAVDPSGKFVYVTGPRVIEAFTVDGTTGELTEVSGSPFRAGIAYEPRVAIDPLGKFIYVMDDTDGSILAYIIDGNTGALTPMAASPVALTHFLSMAVDPSGKFAYVAEWAIVGPNNGVAAYAIDGTNGTLSPIPGSPFAVGTKPYSLAITSTSTVPFEIFKAKADIDEDRKTSFRVEGFFRLGQTSDGIDPVSETVELQVGRFSATIPAGSFREEGKHTFKFHGRINDVDLKITIAHVDWDDHRDRKDHDKGKDHDKRKDHDGGNDYLFTAEGRGDFPTKFVNPVTVGLTIGDYEGSTTVKADIDR